MTQAESRVLACLMEGETLAGAADQLALSLHTVRAHLKAIFAKTSTSRQSEMLRLILGGPATLK